MTKNRGYDHFFKKAKENTGQSPRQKLKRKPNLGARKGFGKQFTKQSRPLADKEVETLLRQAFAVKPKRARGFGSGSARWIISLVSFVGLVSGLGFSFLRYPQDIEEILDRIEFQVFGQTLAKEKKSSENLKNSKSEEKLTTVSAQKLEESSSEKSRGETLMDEPVSQDLSYYAKLNDKRQELDLREKELNELEEELHKQKKEIEERIEHLEKMRVQIATVLKEKVEMDQEKVKTLVEFYSNMKPQQAAKIMESLNEDLAIEVLGRMKKKNAAEIMNLLEPKKAQVISEKFAGYKRR